MCPPCLRTRVHLVTGLYTRRGEGFGRRRVETARVLDRAVVVGQSGVRPSPLACSMSLTDGTDKIAARPTRRRVLGVTAAALASLRARSLRAQTAKRIELLIGYTPGGSYDLYARLVARHLGRFLPGEPVVVPQNMPGAGSLRAANFIYGAAAKDGSVMGIVTETVALEQALSNPAVQYDAARFTWIGRVASSINVQLVWHTAKVQAVRDAYHSEVEARVSAAEPPRSWDRDRSAKGVIR
jgi:hypothetical protein